MYILDKNKNVMVDCDDTLILWHPGSQDSTSIVIQDSLVKPNTQVIETIKKLSRIGYNIIVWSAGGYEWASAVVSALELTSFVDIVMSKPEMYFDDIHCTEWMGEWNRVQKDGTISRFQDSYVNPHRLPPPSNKS